MSSAVETFDKVRAELPPERHPRTEHPPASLPVTILERKPGWRAIDLRELWRYRDLLYILTLRDIKLRYKQTVLGAAWAILQPLATMLVFSLFIGRIAANPSSPVRYPLFVLAGLVPWTFFANAIALAGQSVVGSGDLVTKIYFPRLIMPLGAVGACLVDFAVAFGLLVTTMAVFRCAPGWTSLMLPFLTVGLALAATGVGVFLSALTVAYRDFRHVVPFLVQFWMFATPSIYMQDNSGVGPVLRYLLPFNPAYGLIASFRQSLLGGAIDAYSLAVSGTVSVFVLALGCIYFRRVERVFADII
jgi:lipopolysaccharide transport system permease protein